MQTHRAEVAWSRGDAEFLDRRYPRAHEWRFDGGVIVPASASPHNVREPYSMAAAVDPEEALVAATASCHMLWFLSIAAERGYIVDRYVDTASGMLDRNAEGKVAFTRITLRPRIAFFERSPPEHELARMHEEAHNSCFIANSLRCEVVVASP